LENDLQGVRALPITSILLNQKLDKVAGDFEKALRRELSHKTPITYEVEEQSPTATNAVLKDIGRSFVADLTNKMVSRSVGTLAGTVIGSAAGGVSQNLTKSWAAEAHHMGIVRFDIVQPKQAALYVHVGRHNDIAYAERLFYVTDLKKKIMQPVTLSSSNFEGNVRACAKLNKDRELVRRALAFSRSNVNVSVSSARVPITANSLFLIEPSVRGSLLIAHTLLKKKIIMYYFDAKEFFAIASLIEIML
jgi:hypothetical protein